jgi:hypothetical protein
VLILFVGIGRDDKLALSSLCAGCVPDSDRAIIALQRLHLHSQRGAIFGQQLRHRAESWTVPAG